MAAVSCAAVLALLEVTPGSQTPVAGLASSSELKAILKRPARPLQSARASFSPPTICSEAVA
jgi:hypothetical protein